MDACGTLEAFLQKFLKQLRSYKELKQKSDDLNSILRFSTKQPGDKTSGTGMTGQDRKFEPRFTSKSGKQPFHQKVHAMEEEDPEELDELAVEDDDEVTEEIDESQDVTEYSADDSDLMEEARQMDENISHLAAFAGKSTTEVQPCFNMFNKGKCEVKGCVYSHTKAAAEKISLRRIQGLINSPMVDDLTKTTLRTAERKLLERVKPTSGTSGAKTVLTRSR